MARQGDDGQKRAKERDVSRRNVLHQSEGHWAKKVLFLQGIANLICVFKHARLGGYVRVGRLEITLTSQLFLFLDNDKNTWIADGDF